MPITLRNNTSALNSLRHVDGHYRNIKSSINKLTSGQKINVGADGPASLIASERLRGQMVSTRQALHNTEESISLVQTAEGALNEVNSILVSLRQLSVHAANDGVNDRQMVEADQREAEYLLESIDRIVKNTRFGDRNLLDGSYGITGTAFGEGLHYVEGTEDTQPSPIEGYEVDITQVATRAKVIGSTPITLENVRDGLRFVIKDENTTVDLEVMKGELGESIEKMIDKHEKNPSMFPEEKISGNIRSLILDHLNAAIEEFSANIDVMYTPDNLLMIRHQKFGDETKLSASSSVAGILSDEANVAKVAQPGKDVEGFIDGKIAIGEGQFLYTTEDSKDTKGLKLRFTQTLGLKEVPNFDENGNQIGSKFIDQTNQELVGESTDGFVHVNQNSLSFQVGPEAGQNTHVAFSNMRTNQLAKGIKNESGFESLADIDMTTVQGALDAMKLIDQAMNDVTKERGRLGSFQKNALESNLNHLKINEENLISAESTVRDADIASEMSELTSNQILLSSGTAMLAQANQVPRNVLGLITNSGNQ